ncbi:MAG: hypothetical protein ACJA1P_002736 [Maribacter sp.]|jgi:hypothetical protein
MQSKERQIPLQLFFYSQGIPEKSQIKIQELKP